MRTLIHISLSFALIATSLQADDLEIRIMSPGDGESELFQAELDAEQPLLALMSRQQIEFLTTNERAENESLLLNEKRVLHDAKEETSYAISPSKSGVHGFPAFDFSYRRIDDDVIVLDIAKGKKKGTPSLQVKGKCHHHILFELTDSDAMKAVLCSVAIIGEGHKDGADQLAATQETKSEGDENPTPESDGRSQ